MMTFPPVGNLFVNFVGLSHRGSRTVGFHVAAATV